jgi:hypothetical protein
MSPVSELVVSAGASLLPVTSVTDSVTIVLFETAGADSFKTAGKYLLNCFF